MTEIQAYIVDFVVGLIVTLGAVVLLEALGVGDTYQGVAAMLGLVATAWMVGPISDHYERKKVDGEDRRER
jgi:hypothetical protein